MKIKNPTQKNLLLECFLIETPDGIKQVKFSIEKLADAGSVKTKILKTIKDGKFDDTEIEFTESEVIVIKNIWEVRSKDGFIADHSEAVLELDKILNSVE